MAGSPLSRGGRSGFGPPITDDTRGNTGLESEKLLAYEIGYRAQPSKAVTIDIAAFANFYDDLRSFDPGTPGIEFTPPVPHIRIPVDVQNKLRGESYGVEVAGNWNVNPRLALVRILQRFLTLQLPPVIEQHRYRQPEPDRGQLAPEISSSSTPITTSPRDLEINSGFVLRRATCAPATSPATCGSTLPSPWRPKKDLEFTIGIQNALDDRHAEFGNSLNHRLERDPANGLRTVGLEVLSRSTNRGYHRGDG